MSKRFMISVNDDFYSWLTTEAEDVGIPSATMATILLNEAKKAREAQVSIQMTNDKMKEQLTKLFEAGFQSEIKKNWVKQENEVDSDEKTAKVQGSIQITNDRTKEQFAKMFEEIFAAGFNMKSENNDK